MVQEICCTNNQLKLAAVWENVPKCTEVMIVYHKTDDLEIHSYEG